MRNRLFLIGESPGQIGNLHRPLRQWAHPRKSGLPNSVQSQESPGCWA